MYVISGVGWVVKLLMEDWTNRLNKYDSIYAGLTDEAFWVSVAKAGVLIDKGRERCLTVVWKQASVLKENFERKFLLLPRLTS